MLKNETFKHLEKKYVRHVKKPYCLYTLHNLNFVISIQWNLKTVSIAVKSTAYWMDISVLKQPSENVDCSPTCNDCFMKNFSSYFFMEFSSHFDMYSSK